MVNWQKIILIGGVVILLSVLALLIKFPRPELTNIPAQNATSTDQQSGQNSEIDISGWKTYRNEEYGFFIQYPPDWKIKKIFNSNLLIPGDYVKTCANNPNQNDDCAFIDFLYRPGQTFTAVGIASGRETLIDIKKLPMIDIEQRFFYVHENYFEGIGFRNYYTQGPNGFYGIGLSWRYVDFSSIDKINTEIKEILSTFKFTEPEKVSTGILKGKVMVGPICPVERVDQPCPAPPEAYTSREVIIKSASDDTTIARKNFNPDGTYQFELPPGTYVVEIPAAGAGGSRDLPKTVYIILGQTTIFNFEIDTGIR